MELVYRSPDLPAPAGAVVFAAALLLFVFLEPVALRLRSEEKRTWWASTGRDVVNFLGALALSASIWSLGIALPLAIFLGCTLAIVLVVVGGYVYGRAAHPWLVVLLTAIVLGCPLVVFPGQVAEGIADLLSALFPAVDFHR